MPRGSHETEIYERLKLAGPPASAALASAQNTRKGDVVKLEQSGSLSIVIFFLASSVSPRSR
jgi:hypothetical protein